MAGHWGTPLTWLMLYGWIPFSFVLFASIDARRALLISMLGGWMFLPNTQSPIDLPMITLDKLTVISLGGFLGALCFDNRRIMRFRFRMLDLPMTVFCLSPMASSLSMDLGAYDGFVAALNHVIQWGFPYVLGRVYFRDFADLKELAIAIAAAGFIYVPLCLLEIKFSPQLHNWIYGFHPAAFHQAHRLGGFRPWVFLKHGLTLGMFMATCGLVAWWLWRARARRALLGVSMGWGVGLLLITNVFCRSLGALALLGLGMAALHVASRTSSRWILLLLIIMPPAYMTSRAYLRWDSQELISIARMISEERAGSLETRVHNELSLTERALMRPVFGWGGHGDMRVRDEEGRDVSLTDSRAVIIMGSQGIVGLASFLMAFLLPAWIIVRRMSSKLWRNRTTAPLTALLVLVVLYVNDLCINGSINIIFIMINGAVTTMGIEYVRARGKRVVRPVSGQRVPVGAP